MKRSSICLIIAAVLLCAEPGCRKEPSTDKICDAGSCFSLSKFAQNLTTRLNAATLGYSFAVYYDGALKKWGSNGRGRRAQDGNTFDISPFSTNMNVGSCAKTITTIATLQVLETQKVSLDAKIVDFLPEWWEVGSNVELVTFRDLLTHRSGFRPTNDAVNYVQIRRQVIAGIKAENHGKANYQNMNFCILRIILPILTGDFNAAQEISDEAAGAATTEHFIDYLDTHVFAPVIVDANCTNFDDVLYYDFDDPGANGFDPGDECANSGGGTLSMSANDLAKVICNAAFTDVLLSSANRTRMFDKSQPLGCYSNETHAGKTWPEQFHHNGGFSVGGKGGAACWYIFSNDVVVAVAANSVGGISGNPAYDDINDLIEIAYDEAWE